MSPRELLQRQADRAHRERAGVLSRVYRDRGRLTLSLVLSQQPTARCRRYLVRYVLCMETRPLVTVLSPPPIKHFNNKLTPHLNPDGTLCLFDDAGGQWSIWNPVTHLMAWADRWLVAYEHWEAFGEWRGDHEENAWENQLAAAAKFKATGKSPRRSAS